MPVSVRFVCGDHTATLRDRSEELAADLDRDHAHLGCDDDAGSTIERNRVDLRSKFDGYRCLGPQIPQPHRVVVAAAKRHRTPIHRPQRHAKHRAGVALQDLVGARNRWEQGDESLSASSFSFESVLVPCFLPVGFLKGDHHAALLRGLLERRECLAAQRDAADGGVVCLVVVNFQSERLGQLAGEVLR
jgi:hypothetical protein